MLSAPFTAFSVQCHLGSQQKCVSHWWEPWRKWWWWQSRAQEALVPLQQLGASPLTRVRKAVRVLVGADWSCSACGLHRRVIWWWRPERTPSCSWWTALPALCLFFQGRFSSLSKLLIGLFMAADLTLARWSWTLPCKSCSAYRPSEGFSPGMSQEVVSWFSVSTRAIKVFEIMMSLAEWYLGASWDSAPASRCIMQPRLEFVYWKKKRRKQSLLSLTLFIPQFHQCFLNVLKTKEGLP